MGNVIVTGGRSGLGKALAQSLAFHHRVRVFDISDDPELDVRDITVRKAEQFMERCGLPSLDILVNCAGFNQINWAEDVTRQDWDLVMGTNAWGLFRMTQSFLPALSESKGTVLNIVSNASHVPMSASAAYNASKGAAHILTQQLARELTRRHGITVFGISPNKLAGTAMSESIERQVCETRGWTEEEAKRYQLAALLPGEETPPEEVADFAAFLLSSKARHKYLTGCILPYGA